MYSRSCVCMRVVSIYLGSVVSASMDVWYGLVWYGVVWDVVVWWFGVRVWCCVCFSCGFSRVLVVLCST